VCVLAWCLGAPVVLLHELHGRDPRLREVPRHVELLEAHPVLLPRTRSRAELPCARPGAPPRTQRKHCAAALHTSRAGRERECRRGVNGAGRGGNAWQGGGRKGERGKGGKGEGGLGGAEAAVVEARGEDAVGEVRVHLDSRQDHLGPPRVECLAPVGRHPVYLAAACRARA
jgi:hypothetical protein